MHRSACIALGITTLACALTACGPSVSVMTMKPMTARPADCPLEYVDVAFERITVDKEWTLVGYVTLSETGVQDPFAERYRAIVRPKACELGGTAVTMAMSTASQAAMGSGSGTVYAVLVPYTEPSGEKTTF